MAKRTVKENTETVIETTETAAAEASETVEAAAKQKTASLYTIDDLAAAEQKIGAKKTIIRVALKKAGKDRYTLDEAKKIVAEFKKREVKG